MKKRDRKEERQRGREKGREREGEIEGWKTRRSFPFSMETIYSLSRRVMVLWRSPTLSEGPCFVFDTSKRKDNLFRCNKWCQMRKETKHISNCQIFKYHLPLVYMFQRETKKRGDEVRTESLEKVEGGVHLLPTLCIQVSNQSFAFKMLELKPEFKMKLYKIMSEEPQNLQ